MNTTSSQGALTPSFKGSTTSLDSSLFPSESDLFTASVATLAATYLTPDRVTDFGNQVIGRLGSFFSFFKTDASEKKSQTAQNMASCALGVAAVSSGQPLIQVAGAPLLTGCLNPALVEASPVNGSFIKRGDLSGDFEVTSLKLSVDGGYLISGRVNTNLASGNGDIFISKYDPKGKELWTSILNGPQGEDGQSLEIVNDGNLLAIGNTDSGGRIRIVLSKFLANGTSNSTITIGEAASHFIPRASKVLPNGDVVMAGAHYSFTTSRYSTMLIKTTAEGTPLWNKVLGGLDEHYGEGFTVTQSGDLVVTGGRRLDSTGAWGTTVYKFSSDGNLSWARLINGTGSDLANTVVEAPDGDLVAIVLTNSPNPETANTLVLKLGSNGDLVWGMVLGGKDLEVQPRGILIEPNGEMLIVGTASGFGSGTGFVTKLNASGIPIWTQTLKRNSYPAKIIKANDGGYILSGTQIDPGTGKLGVLLAKIDADGRIPNCNALEFVDLPFSNNMSAFIIDSIEPTNSTIPVSVSPWSPSVVNLRQNQTEICPTNSSTVTATRTIPKTQTPTITKIRSISPFTDTLSSTLSPSLERTSSLAKSQSKTQSQDTISSTDRISKSLDRTFSKTAQKTNTRPKTKTELVELKKYAVIEMPPLLISGVTSLLLSPSSSFLLAQVGNAYQLVTIDPNGKMTKVSDLSANGPPRAVTFSRDEKHIFIADGSKNIQVIDIQNPFSPKPKGSIQIDHPIYSLTTSGGGNTLLVGTGSGIETFTIKDLTNPSSLVPGPKYGTSFPVNAIQSNPNNHMVMVGTDKDLTLLDFADKKWTNLKTLQFSSDVQTIDPIDQLDPTKITLCLQDGKSTLVDISTPTAPTLTPLPSESQNKLIARSGSMLLAAGNKGIQILKNEQDNWSESRSVGYNPTEQVRDILFASNGKFSVYSDSEGIKLIKIVETPGRLDVPLPKVKHTVKLGFPKQSILLNEQKNLIAVGGNQLTFISNENLQEPIVYGNFSTHGNVRGMTFFPDKANLLLSDDKGIACVNCFDPNNLALQSRWETQSQVQSFTLSGSHAYVCQGKGEITVLDVSDKSNISEKNKIKTHAATQAIRFSKDKKLAYVADSTGIGIYAVESPLSFKLLGRLDGIGFVSNIELAPDEETLYYSSGEFLGKVNVKNATNPLQIALKEAPYAIKDIALSNQGNTIYVGVEIEGMLIANTTEMQFKKGFKETKLKQVVLDDGEEKAYVPSGENGLKVVELVKELPIVPLSSRDTFPVGVRVIENLVFRDVDLNEVNVKELNSVHFLVDGRKKDLPDWIEADRKNKTLTIEPPKEFTNKEIQLAISFEVNGVRQETVYPLKIVSSLEIDSQKNTLAILSPSSDADIKMTFNSATAMKQDPGALLASSQGNTLELSGNLGKINQYIQNLRLNPNPPSLSPEDVALKQAHIWATDKVNKFPSEATIPLRNLRFNQQPVVNRPLQFPTIKALTNFKYKVPLDTIVDPDPEDKKLIWSAFLEDGKGGAELPKWLKFDPIEVEFSGIAPVEMLNQTLPIRLSASDGVLSTHLLGSLPIAANHAPKVVNTFTAPVVESGATVSYTIPRSLFSDVDGDDLTFTATEKGKSSLPPDIVFDPKTIGITLQPSADNVGVRTIVVNATDPYGASVQVEFPQKVEFSFWDGVDYVGLRLGPPGALATAAFGIYAYRAELYNTFFRNKYWRNSAPETLLKGNYYQPRKPLGNDLIDEKDIAEIHVRVFDKEKWAHDSAKKSLPYNTFKQRYTRPLINGEPFPSWMEYNPSKVEVWIKNPPAKTETRTFLYEVIGKDGKILESFEIDPKNIDIPLSLRNLPVDEEPLDLPKTEEIKTSHETGSSSKEIHRSEVISRASSMEMKPRNASMAGQGLSEIPEAELRDLLDQIENNHHSSSVPIPDAKPESFELVDLGSSDESDPLLETHSAGGDEEMGELGQSVDGQNFLQSEQSKALEEALLGRKK